jgi:phosphoribosylaminoimidazolecarboxamide formyltransferase/IMP cyclohydrolase
LRIKRALISVYDKRDVDKLAKGLMQFGIEIWATEGTAKHLEGVGVRGVRVVSEEIGSPEILGGRVKTLHPFIHGALLCRRGDPSHMRDVEGMGIKLIDLLVVNLYPFEETVGRGASLEEALEQIDIGGVAMIRSGAKNFEDVAVLVNPSRYEEFLERLREGNGEISREYSLTLAQEAFGYVARYDVAIMRYFESLSGSPFPQRLATFLEKREEMRYGENPHQRAALYLDVFEEGRGTAYHRPIQGKHLSYNNILDMDSAILAAMDLPGSGAVIVKHNNPCGAAIGESLADAFYKAFDSDPVSAFGGIVGFNGKVDLEAAKAVLSVWERGGFMEVVVAPSYEDEALEAFKERPALRVVEVGNPLPRKGGMELRSVGGGALIQERDERTIDLSELKVVTRRAPTEEELESMLFAWRVVKHVKSNAIVFAKGKATVGIGAGQMSRVDSVRIAVWKAGDRAKGAVMASDAFFPFRDGIDEAARAGITAVIQPGGSLRDGEVIEAADEHGIAMVFTGVRHFRH